MPDISDRERTLRRKLRDEFTYYAPRCLSIRTKEGRVAPLRLNKAQAYIHTQLEAQKTHTGRVRALILKGRQQGCCYTADMRVLAADYRWVPISNLPVGERIIALDEDFGENNRAGRRTERRIRIAVVEAKVEHQHETFEVTLDNGVVLKVTGEHRHLCQQRGGCMTAWRAVSDMKPGDYIRALCAPPDDGEPTYEDGWFGGLLDGEGSFGASPQIRISLSQINGPVLERAKRYLDSKGIRYYELIDTRSIGLNKLGGKEVHCLRIDRASDVLRLLALTRPARFVGRELFVGKKLFKTCPGFNAWAKVLSIKSVGVQTVYDIQTSEKTFICEGLVSHNSTYVGGRFYHQTTHRKGVRTFILTHEDAATANLFEMVNRYHEHCNPLVKPSTGAANAKELRFDRLDSGYKVGTAGTKGTGRSSTIQLLHGSEVGFWPNAESHAAGVFQAVPDEDGTEIILESTANGVGNLFFSMWKAAEAGQGDFIAVFVPWFWSDEYRRKPEPGFELDADEREYAQQYGLDLEQMAWRRNKIEVLKDAGLFKQEFPATAAEAFQISGHDGLIRPELVVRARKNYVEDLGYGPLVIGFDPAWTGGDRHAMAWRRGRKLLKLEARTHLDTMQAAGWCKQVIDKDNPRRFFIDVGGVGAGVYDRLCEMGYTRIVRPINFGSSPMEPGGVDGGGPLNRRAEIWCKVRDWLEDPAGVDIPDEDALQADLCGPGYRYDSNTRLVLEKKEDMRKRGVPSPDLGDAVALTFAEAVPPSFEDKPGNDAYERPRRGGSNSDWMAA